MMDTARFRQVALHTVCAGVFMFVLNYYVLNSGLESSLSWAVAFAAMAAGLAYRQTKS
jgi:hypothetical protein